MAEAAEKATESEDERRYVSVVMAAKLLGLSANKVRQMDAEGRFDSFRTSPRGHIRIRVDRDGYPILLEPVP